MTTDTARMTASRPRIATTTLIAAAGSVILAVIAFPIATTTAYAWVLTVLLAIAAAAVAVVDARTHLLPNRYVAPIAVAGLIQVTVVAIAAGDPGRLLFAVLAAAAVFAGYVLMGMLNWFGFGDAKFAAALVLTVGIYAGLAAIYLIPLAIVLAAAGRLALQAVGRGAGQHAHGPVIAVSAIAVMIAAVVL